MINFTTKEWLITALVVLVMVVVCWINGIRGVL